MVHNQHRTPDFSPRMRFELLETTFNQFQFVTHSSFASQARGLRLQKKDANNLNGSNARKAAQPTLVIKPKGMAAMTRISRIDTSRCSRRQRSREVVSDDLRRDFRTGGLRAHFGALVVQANLIASHRARLTSEQGWLITEHATFVRWAAPKTPETVRSGLGHTAPVIRSTAISCQ
jgi:hypothetical protein